MKTSAFLSARNPPSVRAGRWLLAVALLAFWAWSSQRLGPSTVASPWQTLERLGTVAVDGGLWRDLQATARVVLVGLLAGWLIGMILTLAMTASPRFAAAIEPYILASMGVPKFALAPLLILWFGIGDAPKAVVVTLMVFYAVLVTALAGSRAVDRRLMAMAHLMGATPRAAVLHVLLPAMVPYLISGMRVAIPRAISAAVVGEFIVADAGLGFYIEHSRQTNDIVGVYAGLVVVAVLVLASDALLGMLERRLLRWRPQRAIGGVH